MPARSSLAFSHEFASLPSRRSSGSEKPRIMSRRKSASPKIGHNKQPPIKIPYYSGTKCAARGRDFKKRRWQYLNGYFQTNETVNCALLLTLWKLLNYERRKHKFAITELFPSLFRSLQSFKTYRRGGYIQFKNNKTKGNSKSTVITSDH